MAPSAVLFSYRMAPSAVLFSYRVAPSAVLFSYRMAPSAVLFSYRVAPSAMLFSYRVAPSAMLFGNGMVTMPQTRICQPTKQVCLNKNLFLPTTPHYIDEFLKVRNQPSGHTHN